MTSLVMNNELEEMCKEAAARPHWGTTHALAWWE